MVIHTAEAFTELLDDLVEKLGAHIPKPYLDEGYVAHGFYSKTVSDGDSLGLHGVEEVLQPRVRLLAVLDGLDSLDGDVEEALVHLLSAIKLTVGT